MIIRLISPSNRMPAWVETGFKTYQSRLPKQCQLQLCELPLAKRQKNSPKTAIQAEGDAILAALKDELVVALAISGKPLSTEQLSQELEKWMHSGKNVALVIGGPDGLDPRVLERADADWSLSPLTLPHPLVRIVVAEQIYRAYTRLINHPYDK